MVKMSKIDNFLKLFSILKKNSLSWFYIKSHPFIHCHIYALKNGTCQDELSITKGVQRTMLPMRRFSERSKQPLENMTNS